ncbi:Threonine dehydrogenase and related Zn-dependent dehydrogenases [hydrothermal vent metagenome]|uniref:Threonine dehydrogenase and related Zn-dependent dehydrogenases n=1 Tax=hydrothermal vent metagenome TaxID=652676 RepID=A0A3B0V3Z0_9ZZZZ
MTKAGKAFSSGLPPITLKKPPERIFSMKAVVFDKGLKIVEDHPVPVPAAGEALLRVILAGICATDMEITKGYMGFTGVLGHEFVATVIECRAKPELIGRRVTGEINIGCNNCELCRSGLSNHCPNRNVLGILGRDGAMAQYLTLPAGNLHIVPDSVSESEAALTEPLAAAFQITREHEITPSSSVCVLGGGRLGAMAALAINETGCKLIVCGRNAEKNKIINGFGIKTTLPEELEGRFDYVVECTGTPVGLNHAIRLTKPKGTIILKTTVAKPAPLDLNNIVINELKISGSRCGPFKLALDFLDKYSRGHAEGHKGLGSLISAVYPLKDAVRAFDRAGSKGTMKILLEVKNDGLV